MRSKGFAADASTASLFLGLLTAPNVGDEDKALLQKYFLEKNGQFSENCVELGLIRNGKLSSSKLLPSKYYLVQV
ncbi:hypothetical protein KSS87_016147 [Heliosperma pusillum]|nr:hypothetical protein KSS87_016147 [Heliosperma pusillum]